MVYFVSMFGKSKTCWRQMMPRRKFSHTLLALENTSCLKTPVSDPRIINTMFWGQSNPWPVLTLVSFNGLMKLSAGIFSHLISRSLILLLFVSSFTKWYDRSMSPFPSYTIGALCPPIYNIVVAIRCRRIVEHEMQLRIEGPYSWHDGALVTHETKFCFQSVKRGAGLFSAVPRKNSNILSVQQDW